MNLFDLHGQIAVVTGASSGLGVEFAKALGLAGAKVALVARREEKLKAVKEKLTSEKIECEYFICDVSDTNSVEGAVEDILDKFGSIEILVNNAGLGLGAEITEMSDEDWNMMMSTNVDGPFRFQRAVVKHMKEKNYGRIINTGSIHSQVALSGNTRLTSYATTKGAILMMTKALAAGLARYGITVNAIGPSYFDSEMTHERLENKVFKEFVESACPMGRIGKLEELDTAILYFASKNSSYTTGQILFVDGGWTSI